MYPRVIRLQKHTYEATPELDRSQCLKPPSLTSKFCPGYKALVCSSGFIWSALFPDNVRGKIYYRNSPQPQQTPYSHYKKGANHNLRILVADQSSHGAIFFSHSIVPDSDFDTK